MKLKTILNILAQTQSTKDLIFEWTGWITLAICGLVLVFLFLAMIKEFFIDESDWAINRAHRKAEKRRTLMKSERKVKELEDQLKSRGGEVLNALRHEQFLHTDYQRMLEAHGQVIENKDRKIEELKNHIECLKAEINYGIEARSEVKDTIKTSTFNNLQNLKRIKVLQEVIKVKDKLILKLEKDVENLKTKGDVTK